MPSARARTRAALHVHGRAVRRPVPGREPRVDQGDRSLRPGSRREVLKLCGTHHPGRAEAPLPRQGLGAARAARPPGAHPRRKSRNGGALEAAGPVAEAARGRPARSGAPSSRCSRRNRPPSATRPRRSTRQRRVTTTGRTAGRPARRRGLGLRARRGPRRNSEQLEGAARRRALGARAALCARPQPARDRRTHRLLANARLTAATPRAQPTRNSRGSSITVLDSGVVFAETPCGRASRANRPLPDRARLT